MLRTQRRRKKGDAQGQERQWGVPKGKERPRGVPKGKGEREKTGIIIEEALKIFIEGVGKENKANRRKARRQVNKSKQKQGNQRERKEDRRLNHPLHHQRASAKRHGEKKQQGQWEYHV
jgi:hypothetical protein